MSNHKKSGSRSGGKGRARQQANRHRAEAGSHLTPATQDTEEPDATLPEQADLLAEFESMSEGDPEHTEAAIPLPAEALDPVAAEDFEAGPIGTEPLGAPRSALDESLLQIGELEERGAYHLSLERLVALQADQPDSAAVLARIGSVLGSLGRFGEAEAALEQAYRMSPDDLDIRAGMGIVEFKRGLYDQAEATLRWVCDRQPDHGPAHLYRGEALHLLGRIDEALAALVRASELDPDNPRIYQTLGMIYDKRREPNEAARMYKRAGELGRR